MISVSISYLIYNKVYVATSGDGHIRRDLAKEAVFLSRLSVDLIPEPDTIDLLASIIPTDTHLAKVF